MVIWKCELYNNGYIKHEWSLELIFAICNLNLKGSFDNSLIDLLLF